jgi:hypothetical protein
MIRIRLVRHPSFTDLESALRLAEGPEKTAAVASWFQGLYNGQPDAEVPALVGEGAVELHSEGAYSADLLEFAGGLPTSVSRRLKAAGFVEDEGQWSHDAEVTLEIGSHRLDPNQRVVTLKLATGDVRLLSGEDVLLDLLALWQHEESPLEALTAFQFWRRLWAKLDLERLAAEAARRGLGRALERLRSFDAGLGERWPDLQELQRWARELA